MSRILQETIYQPNPLLWILLGSFLLRLVSVPLVHSTGYTSDEQEYISLGRKVAYGGEFIDSNGERSTRSPLFPFMLAGMFAVAGEGLAFPHVVGCVLGTLAVAFGYLLSLRLFGNTGAALATAIATGLYPGLVVYSALLQTETLFIVFFLGVFLAGYYILQKPSLPGSALLGLAGGLAALTRSIFLGAFPVILLSISWIGYKKGQRVLIPGFLSLVAFCAVILPWTVRNYQVHHTVVPISSWAGRSLLIANNPFATGTWSVKTGFETWLDQQLKSLGIGSTSQLTEMELSSASRDIAFKYITSHPGEAALLAAKRAHIFSVYPITHSDSYRPLQAIAVGADILLLVVASLGLVASWSDHSTLTPFLWSIVIFVVTHSVLQAEARYRLPLVPLFCLFFGLGISSLGMKKRLQEALKPGKQRFCFGALAGVIVAVYSYTGWLFLSGKV